MHVQVTFKLDALRNSLEKMYSSINSLTEHSSNLFVSSTCFFFLSRIIIELFCL